MLRGKIPHFRLTCVAQKRCCLSSLLANFTWPWVRVCANPRVAMELLTRTWFPDLNITKHWRSYILETQANWQIGSSIKDGKNLCKYWKASTFSRFYAFISSLLVTTTSRQLDWKGEVVLIIVGELFVVLEYNILTVYFCTKQSPFIRYTLSLQKQRVAGCISWLRRHSYCRPKTED